jgi:DNA polymerase IIIc chi subunit
MTGLKILVAGRVPIQSSKVRGYEARRFTIVVVQYIPRGKAASLQTAHAEQWHLLRQAGYPQNQIREKDSLPTLTLSLRRIMLLALKFY